MDPRPADHRGRLRRGGRLAGPLLLALCLAGCEPALDLSHHETRCIHPGDPVTLETDAPPGSILMYQVQDDFGGSLPPDIPQETVPPSGHATVVWRSPGSLSTTTVHFLLHAVKGDRHARRDIHVRVRKAGEAC